MNKILKFLIGSLLVGIPIYIIYVFNAFRILLTFLLWGILGTMFLVGLVVLYLLFSELRKEKMDEENA